MLPASFIPAAEAQRQGFFQVTNRVLKRYRLGGLLDVLYLESDGTYSIWTSEQSSIWLAVGPFPLKQRVPVQSKPDLLDLLAHFPTDSLPS